MTRRVGRADRDKSGHRVCLVSRGRRLRGRPPIDAERDTPHLTAQENAGVGAFDFGQCARFGVPVPLITSRIEDGECRACLSLESSS